MKKVTVSISEHITENFKSYSIPFLNLNLMIPVELLRISIDLQIIS